MAKQLHDLMRERIKSMPPHEVEIPDPLNIAPKVSAV